MQKNSLMRAIMAVAVVGTFAPRAWSQADVGAPGTELPGTSALNVTSEGGPDVAQLLGNTYKDEDAGIIIAPPAGSRLIRREGLDLLTFVQDEKQWGGSVQLVTVNGKMSVDEYVAASTAQLSKTFAAVQTASKQLFKFNNMDAARVGISMQKTAIEQGRPLTVAIYREELIVKVPPSSVLPGAATDPLAGPTERSQFMMVTLYTPLKEMQSAQQTFEAMCKSFVILNKEDVLKQRRQAAKAGQEWLAKRTPEELRGKMLPDQYFRVKVGGKDVGYIVMVDTDFGDGNPRVDPTTGTKTTGIQEVVASWTFPPVQANNGNAVPVMVNSRSVAFWSYRKDTKGNDRPDFSEWDSASRVVTQVPPNKVNPTGGFVLNWRRETGSLFLEQSHFAPDVLEQLQAERKKLIEQHPEKPVPPEIKNDTGLYHMKVTLTGDNQQMVNMNQNQNARGLDAQIPPYLPAPLPKILEYTWTRVVDLSKPSQMSFCVYNFTTDTQTPPLTMRTLTVVGPETITIDGQSVKAIRCTDEVESNVTVLWVDGTGRVLMMRSADQSLLLNTTKDKMQQLWGARQREGEAAASGALGSTR